MSLKLSVPDRLLFGPGPSDIDESVYAALSQKIIGHLDPEFIKLMEGIKENLQHVFQTKNKLTFPISAPGSAGMEACFMNLVEEGDHALICINGVFGKRMLENVERLGGVPHVLEFEWGKPIDLDILEETLKANPKIQVLGFVHAETSTGVESNAAEIAKLAGQYDVLTIMDCVTSLGGSPVLIDEWGIDAAYSGSQKCLSCVPGLSPVSFGAKAIDKIKKRKQKVRSWFLDLNLVMSYWETQTKRSYHHTAPVNSLYALYQSLENLRAEGLENSWKRHRENHDYLKVHLESLGFRFLVDPAYRLAQLNCVFVPEGVDEQELRMKLLNDYQIEVGGGLGRFAGQVWRIGLMGSSSNKDKINRLLAALKQELQ